MVSTLTWVLAGIVLYTVLAMALRTVGVIPEFVRVQGPITTIHTKRGRALLDRIAAPRRFWRAWGNFGVGIALVVMVGSFFLVLLAGFRAVSQPTASAVRNPQNVLVIPGVNDFLPLAAAPEIVFGLLAGLVVHEGGHGILCRAENIEIDSMGLALLTLIPLGAFVEPSERSRDNANRGAQTRMFAAGVTNNFALAFVAFVLLFGPVVGSISVVSGVPVGDVAPGSAAERAGIERGDVITGVDGQPVEDPAALEGVLANTSDRTVEIQRRDGDPVPVERTLMITRAVPDVLAGTGSEGGVDLSGEAPPRITAVNGTPVHSERAFRTAIENRTVATVATTAGNATFPVGAYVAQVSEGGPIERAGAPPETTMIVTRVGGDRVVDVGTLRSALAQRRPGDAVTVEAYIDRDGFERRAYEVTLGENPNGGALLGVRGTAFQNGVSGLVVDDFGIDVYPAEAFLGLLGGNSGGALGGLTDGDFTRQIAAVLLLPFISAVEPGIAYNFAGFIPPVAGFYTAGGGPLAFMGGWVLTAANVLFWASWINLQLGLFNCIPSFPLDGGHILRASTEAVVARLPMAGGRRLTTAVTVAVSLSMIGGLLLMVFGPGLLAA